MQLMMMLFGMTPHQPQVFLVLEITPQQMVVVLILIAYCFSEKKGFSKFGSYTGNGNADGTFVFRISSCLDNVKRIDATDGWRIRDAKRDIDNPAQHRLLATAKFNNPEVVASSQDTDFLSNGFKIRNSDSGYNTSGATYNLHGFRRITFRKF